jgi:hypothetical protein
MLYREIWTIEDIENREIQEEVKDALFTANYHIKQVLKERKEK